MSAPNAGESPTPFADYRPFILELKCLMQRRWESDAQNDRANAVLNGAASAELRRVSSLSTRRAYGAFFTSTDLSNRLLSFRHRFSRRSIFYDPSSGMGDLLLAAARCLSQEKTFFKTLQQWGKQLAGTDLNREFIEGTKARLVLLAQQRHGVVSGSIDSLAGLFPMIRVGNGRIHRATYSKATHLLLNPPFGLVDSPKDCDWAGGRITEAAMFVITALERSRPGTELFAILPDVLRSGSFSEDWRKRVSELAKVCSIEPYGIFDDSADVDVFLMRLIRRCNQERPSKIKWFISDRLVKQKVGDYFNVHVGRVVPHRDPEIGPEHPYIHARCIPIWAVVRTFSETRRHEGRVYKPPFIVIRRTSRPGHRFRAAATIIGGKVPVAVENHLIVCEPKDMKYASCRTLIQQLKSEHVNAYLNARIRCRHLTVGSVRDIPFEPS